MGKDNVNPLSEALCSDEMRDMMNDLHWRTGRQAARSI